MLSAEQMARLLGTTRTTVNTKRSNHQLLGLEGAKRGIPFPSLASWPRRQAIPRIAGVVRPNGRQSLGGLPLSCPASFRTRGAYRSRSSGQRTMRSRPSRRPKAWPRRSVEWFLLYAQPPASAQGQSRLSDYRRRGAIRPKSTLTAIRIRSAAARRPADSERCRGIECPKTNLAFCISGKSLKVCFLEALLRDKRNGAIPSAYPLDETELRARRFAIVEIAERLSMVNLRGDGSIYAWVLPVLLGHFAPFSLSCLVSGVLRPSPLGRTASSIPPGSMGRQDTGRL